MTALVVGQATRKPAPTKGPRALGLLELGPDGKARLIPIVILDQGQFYDAGAYKAAPVPMSLESGTVYEAIHTGISMGLFTVAGALQANHSWMGQGTWQPAGAKPAPAKAANAAPATDQDEPPKLRRGGPQQTPPAPAPEPSKPASSEAAPPPAPETPAPSAPAAAVPEENDADRPVLRRGVPSPKTHKETVPATPAKAADRKSNSGSPVAPKGIQSIPAISDAAGPDPRPYAFDWKPEEKEQFQKKILVLAVEAVTSRLKELAAGAPPTAPAPSHAAGQRRNSAKPLQPAFDDIQLSAFDLSNSNEPILVFTAKAGMPQRPGSAPSGFPYFLTLVAREDIYGDLHKLFASVTDAQHLDLLPRFDFIDAVDADGDGRGELLFRRVFDSGSAFAVYRVTGDRLWPLYEGAPSE